MKLARWLLERFEVQESLIGDIEEERTGHSVWWLARQVLVAIATAAMRDMRSRKLLAVRALAVGWGTLWLTGAAVTILLRGFDAPDPLFFGTPLIAGLLAGCAVAWFHRPRASMGSLFVMSIALCWITGMFSEGFEIAVVLLITGALVGGLPWPPRSFV